MPLNLVARKSLRDNEEHFNKAHEDIKNALGGEEWTIEFDWEVIFDKVDANAQKQLGETFYKNVCPQIVKCIESACKDEIAKEAMINANSQKKIVVQANEEKKSPPYWKYEFSNGQLNLLFRAPSICNVSDAGSFQLYKVIPSEGVYTLPTRLNLKKNQERFEIALERIKAVTHRDWILDDASLETVYTTAIDTENAKEQFGDNFAQVIEYAATNIEKRSKDEITLEAFNAATESGRISFRHNPKQSSYWIWSFADSDLIITFKSMCNLSDNSNFEYINVLPVPGVFSLIARLNMQKNQEKFDTAFERLNKVTKMDWSYDQESLEIVYPKLDTESNKARIGDIFSEVINYISLNIEKRCDDDMVLESFLEATSNAKIVFKIDPKQGKYWIWSFVNGDLLVSFKSICNNSENNNFDFIEVLPSPGVLSLVAKLSLKENSDKINESLEKIKAVTKLDWSYDQASLEEVYPKLDSESHRSRVGSIFEEIIKYIASNIEKRCADEMVLEAFTELNSNAKIVFRHDPKVSGYWQWIFEGGNLIVVFKSICNTSENANFNFEKLL